MSITVALTEDQRSLLQLSLEIARDRFKKHVRTLGNTLPKFEAERLAYQFDKQAKEADELLMWVTEAENVIVEERRD